MPAIMNRIENIDHMKLLAVGTLPTSGSCGKLLVYDFTSPGRAVTVAHAAQKKQPVIMRRCSMSGTDSSRSESDSRRSAVAGSLDKPLRPAERRGGEEGVGAGR